MSSETQNSGHLFIIAAPSGAGKTSLVKALLEKDPRLVLSVSHTTRAPRPGEIDGQHYHFTDVTDFTRKADNGEFLEHARVFDHLYGTHRDAVARQLAEGLDVLLEIDWQGARQVRAAFPDSCSVFILPPSLDTLRTRLTGRGQDSDTVIDRRMRDARAEISHWAEFDQLLVNDNFETALERLLEILEQHRAGRTLNVTKEHRQLAERLGRS